MKPALLLLALVAAGAYTDRDVGVRVGVNGNGPHREAGAVPRDALDVGRGGISRAIYASPLPVQLPILVGFGPDGGITGSTTTVTLTAGPNGADSLYAVFSNAAYEANDRPGTATFDPNNLADLSRHERRDDAACLRINGGEWICDWNTNPRVTTLRRERLRGGFGGWYSNVRASVALGTPAGGSQNVVVEFRWNGTEGLRSGYRVIDLDLSRGGVRQNHPTTLSTPAPYTTHPDSLAQGRVLWTTRHILSDFGPGGEYRQIIASCNDCHVSGGRDLARFGYEAPVIVARGKFHGLTEAQARNVANYVLSLRATLNPATANECRPWNPPFQPGPGLDERTVGGWICGGGAGAVLERDAGMVGHLFPTGTHPDSIRALYGGVAGAERVGGINRREMPIPHELPLWNDWLPRVSMPDMALDWHAYCQGEFTLCRETSDLGRRDGEGWGRDREFDTPEENAARIETQRRYFQGTSGGVTHEYYLRQNGMQYPVRRAPYTGTPYVGPSGGFWHQVANQSIHQALAVRLFDVVTHSVRTPWGETGWDLANDITCAVPNTPGFPYTWPGSTSMLLGATAPGTSTSGRTPCAETRGLTAAQADWTFFAVSTHISTRDGTGGPWDYPSNHAPATGVTNRNGFDGHIWYTLAQILEPPARFTAPGSLSDENYVHGHTFGAALPGSPASLEAIADGWGMQHRMQGPRGVPRTEGNWKQDHLHHLMHSPWFYQPGQWAETTQQLGPQVAADIQAGLAEAMLDRMERYPASAWDQVRGTGFAELDPRNSTFTAPSAPHPGEWMSVGNYLVHWTALLRHVGARARTVDRMARFGASLFDTPSAFAAFMCPQAGCEEEPPPPPPPPVNERPSVFITAPREGAKNVRNPVTVTVDATDRDGTIREVRLYCQTTSAPTRSLCAVDRTAPWSFSVTLPPYMTQTIHVEGEDDDGAITLTPARTFRMRVTTDR